MAEPVAHVAPAPATVMRLRNAAADDGASARSAVASPRAAMTPTLTAVSPTSGPSTGGTLVTITGTNFTGATSISFDNLPSSAATTTFFTVVSDTEITVTTPAVTTAGVADVVVTTPNGSSAISTADQFTFGSPSSIAPMVDSVTPTTGSTAGGTSVTIAGSGFTAASTVKFGSVAATNVIVDSAGQITANAPAEAAATVDVTVTTGGGTSATSVADQFTYAAAMAGAPTVTAVSPNTGVTTGGTTVTITGTNFTGATAVKFGTTPATSFTVVSATQITATAPAGAAGAANVTVTNANGTSATSASDQFTYGAAMAAQTFTVSNLLDENGMGNPITGSLRAAIIAANAAPGSTIVFNPATVTGPIALDADLPPITAAGTIINGTTAANGVAEVNATAVTSSAFDVQAANVTLEGLAIIDAGDNFDDSGTVAAITLDTGSSDCTVQGSYIGLLPTGTSGAARDGIVITNGSHGNTIGGTTAAERNVIGDNGHDPLGAAGAGYGIEILSGTPSTTTGNIIEGNYIGLDPTGLVAAPNGTGVLLAAVTGNTVENNYISGNSLEFTNLEATTSQGSGVQTSDPTTPNAEFGNTIRNNTIGLNTALAAVPDATGILLTNLPTTTVGDTVSGNTISGNTNAGIEASGSDNTIVSNTIESNGGAGVLIDPSGQRDTISKNTFSLNGTITTGKSAGLAIDLGGNGVVANSPTGGTSTTNAQGASIANGLQPYPTLAVTSGATTATITITVQSNPGTIYNVELYANNTASTSPTGYGQGLIYLRTVQVTTDPTTALGTTTVTIPNSELSTNITATATNASPYNATSNVEAGATSEFALNQATSAGTSTGGGTGGGGTGTSNIALYIGDSVTLYEGHTKLDKTDAFFTDTTGSGPYTATVNWGDGTPLQDVPYDSLDKLTLVHQFDGHVSHTYVVTVNVYDSTSDSKHTFDVTIVNNPPHALTVRSLTRAAATTNVPFEAIARFADAGAGNGDHFRVTIDYGDGTAKTVRTTTKSAFDIVHQYTHPGHYDLQVTVIDDGGRRGDFLTDHQRLRAEDDDGLSIASLGPAPPKKKLAL